MCVMCCREKLFDQRCNHESVEVLPVDSATDLDWLRDTLQEFVNKTGSTLAQTLLADWPASAKLFVKVCWSLLLLEIIYEFGSYICKKKFSCAIVGLCHLSVEMSSANLRYDERIQFTKYQ